MMKKKKKNREKFDTFFNELTYSQRLIHLINYCATGDARVDETSTSTTKNVARVSINEIVKITITYAETHHNTATRSKMQDATE